MEQGYEEPGNAIKDENIGDREMTSLIHDEVEVPNEQGTNYSLTAAVGPLHWLWKCSLPSRPRASISSEIWNGGFSGTCGVMEASRCAQSIFLHTWKNAITETKIQIPKLEAVNRKNKTGERSKKANLQNNLESELESLKKDLEAMRNQLSEPGARYKAELEKVSSSALRLKTENEKLQKELDAIRFNKDADRKDLVILAKAVEESFSHQAENTECLQEVNLLSSQLNNCDSEATNKRDGVLNKQATEIARLQNELETASSNLKAGEEAHRMDLVDVQKVAEGALVQQEKRYETAMAKLKDDLDILQKKLIDQEEAPKSQLAAVIEANLIDVAKVEEKQYPECKNVDLNAEVISSLRTKLGKSDQIKEEMILRLEKNEQLRVDLIKQKEVYKEKLDKIQMNLKEFVAVKASLSISEEKLDMQNKQYEVNRRKLQDVNKQLELCKTKLAECKKRDADANAQLQIEMQKQLECQKKEKELLNSFEQKKKELRDELDGYKLRLSEFEQQLQVVWKLTNTETIPGLQSQIEQMKKDAKTDAAALQFLTVERDCATKELELAKRDRNHEISLVAVLFLVVLCVFCLWGKVDMWNKYS